MNGVLLVSHLGRSFVRSLSFAPRLSLAILSGRADVFSCFQRSAQ